MKKWVLIAVVMMSLPGCRAQPNGEWRSYSVSAHVKDSFLFYMKEANKKYPEAQKDFIDLPAIMIPYQLGDSVFKDPLKEAGIVECQCAFSDDTLTIAIGDGYYTGAFFIAKANKNLSRSSFLAWSDEADLKLVSGDKWREEIELIADKFELALSKKAPFSIEETIYGIWEADYPAYLEKGDDEVHTMKNKVKVYFSCRIEDKIQ